jgi:hypothetical protein
MSDLDDAITSLEGAIARLEAASGRERHAAMNPRVPEIAAVIAARLDTALAKLGQLLDRED